VKKIIKSWLSPLPWSVRDQITYFTTFRRRANMKNPVYFTEKLLCRKHYDCNENALFSLLADKYRVRSYVEEKIGADYLIPLQHTVENPDDLRALRMSLDDVVVKPTHGAGMVHFFETPPSEQALDDAMITFQQWLAADFGSRSHEYHYQAIPPRLMIEKRIHGEEPSLRDYKIHLFRQSDGSHWYVLQTIDNRFIGEVRHRFYINSMEHADLVSARTLLEKAVELSIILADRLDYARYDWYVAAGKLWFGEITLTPAAGFTVSLGEELDKLMGSRWNYQKPLVAPKPTAARPA